MAKHAPHRVQSAQSVYPAQTHFIRPTAAALAVAACFSGPVLANPTGHTVVHGTASVQQIGSILNITNSHNAIINWGSFSIGVNELTRFIQPSALSAVLNRVIGQDPSAILGALQSNGRVFLLNPNGIVFGAGSQINVAGLVASTLNLSNDDFLNNRMRFTDGAGAGSVVNQGSITGGNVYLVGKSVSNEGLITSPNGEVVLAAGNSVELVNPGTPNLRVEVVAPDNEARNLGTISAEAGRIGIYAGLIKQSGTLNASSAVSEGGKIMLKATRNTTLDAGSQTTASGTTGGTIAVQSGDTTLVAGDIAATGSAGNGGTVQVLGNKVGLIDAASVDASGATGGGTVLVGGDYQGKNADVQNAFRSYVGPNATIKADAITSGDGGKVIVWADDSTRFYGDISARGGAIGGDGGFVEVSGKRWLDYQGLADTRAPNGKTGTLLLDPADILINPGNTTNGIFVVDDFFGSAYGGPVLIGWDDVVTQLGISNAIISTANAFTDVGSGNIMIAGPSPDLTSTNMLKLIAENNIQVNGSITNTQAGNIVMEAGLISGSGSITLHAPISTLGMVSLNSGGDITQNAAGAISANELRASSANGLVSLDAAMNQVVTLAGSAAGSFAFKNSGNLTIGSVDGLTGITVNASNGNSATINVEVIGGTLMVNSPVYARGGDGSEGGGNATITLASSSSMQINSPITADGGEGGGICCSGTAGPGGNATVNLTSGGGLTIDSGVYANGGLGGYGSSANGGRGGDGVVNATVAGTLMIGASGDVIGQGGQGGYASYSGTAGRGGDGKVIMSAVGGITVDGQVRGYGGDGGDGGSFSYSYGGGAGGNGGDGVVALTSTGGSITVAGNVSAAGGWGGDAGSGGSSYSYGGAGFGGNGGNAAVTLTATGGITVSGNVSAEGGWAGYGSFGIGFAGGNATVNLSSMGNMTIMGGAINADGGEGIQGGNAAIMMTSAGAIEVMGSVQASGGSGYFDGAGGAATINLTATGAITVAGEVDANGGDGSLGAAGGAASVTLTSTTSNISISSESEVEARGGSADFYGSGTGGTGTLVISSAGDIFLGSFSFVEAYGGDGGESGIAGNALVLLSASGGITANNSRIHAFGGSVDSGQGGAAAVTMLAGGNIQMEGAEGAAWGGSGATGGDTAVTVVAGGNIDLIGGPYSNLFAYSNSGGMPGTSSVAVSAAGNVTLASNANIYSSGLIGIGGVNISLDASGASGGTGVNVDATGSLTLMNNSSLSSGGSAVIKTGGNVTVDSSGIYGNPEVVMNVGGVINMSNSGTIEAGSPSTIFLTFPMLASGGYFVDGVEGVVYDSGTGFVVLGSPAILGTNLFVFYGGGQLDIPTDALIVAMGQSTTPPDPERDKDVFEDLKKNKDKEAPVCR